MSSSSASSSDGTKFHEADLALAAANSLATEQTDKRPSRSGSRSSKGAQKAPETPIQPTQAQQPLNSPVSSDEEEEQDLKLPTGNKEAVYTSTNTPTGESTSVTEKETNFQAGKSLLESIASNKHKSDTLFIARQIQAQHIFVEMSLAHTLILSNYSLSEDAMIMELKKFAFLDLFCIVKKEEMTNSYPIADINPRTWKQAIASSPESSIITSLENIFISSMDDEHTWHLHNIAGPPTRELEDLNIDLGILTTELRADQLACFICLAKNPNVNNSLNKWICESFEDTNGNNCNITFPTSQQKEAGLQLASLNLQDHQSRIYEAKAVLSPKGSLDPQVFDQAQQPVGALFQSIIPGPLGTRYNLLGEQIRGVNSLGVGGIPAIDTLAILALSNQQKQYLAENKRKFPLIFTIIDELSTDTSLDWLTQQFGSPTASVYTKELLQSRWAKVTNNLPSTTQDLRCFTEKILTTMKFQARSEYDVNFDSDDYINYFDAIITKTGESATKYQLPTDTDSVAKPHMIKAALKSWAKSFDMFFDIDITSGLLSFLNFCEEEAPEFTQVERFLFTKKLFRSMCQSAMDTLGNPGTTFTQRMAAGLEETFSTYKGDVAKLTREIELRKDSSRDSYIIESRKRPANLITSPIGGGGGGGGGTAVSSNPKGKKLQQTEAATTCFFNVESKAGITNNKVCEVPCFYGPHQKDLKTYITAAGTKDKLIASISKFRDGGRVKVLTAAIKAHK